MFQFAFFASIWTWAGVDAWVFLRDRRRVQGRAADRGSLWTIVAVVALSITGAFWALGVVPTATFAQHRALAFWLGLALMWGGLGLRVWAVVTLGRFFRTTVFIQEEHQLVTRGPYRILRHPAYAGSILTMIGLGVAFTNWVSLGFMLAGAVLAYAWRIPSEEAALATAFGEAFTVHRKRTWAVLPFVW